MSSLLDFAFDVKSNTKCNKSQEGNDNNGTGEILALPLDTTPEDSDENFLQ
jgi:hypothetical protein